jgi:hypothetical protein
MAQQETLELLSGPALIALGERAHPHQLAHRLMGFVGHPDLDQVTGAQVLRQRHRIAAVVLHPITGFAGNQGWSHHVAAVPETAQATLHHVATRARLVGKVQLGAGGGQLLAQPPQSVQRVGDRAVVGA